MGALLPTLQADHLREGLTDYLATTFALTDPDAQAALIDFVGHPLEGMFKGPYVRLRARDQVVVTWSGKRSELLGS
ncbi:hypothetical protein [Nocardia asteroides]|uniref:hypothetical protein n=1 Tax=Nocardia asteroides TaxID=1824 RepID=UPI001E2F9FD0|nr:hypothetical protein [Nocardia asteroides]UGT60876.1 hypothetical protein LTT61_27615 [Nocardia asteroides]